MNANKNVYRSSLFTEGLIRSDVVTVLVMFLKIRCNLGLLNNYTYSISIIRSQSSFITIHCQTL